MSTAAPNPDNSHALTCALADLCEATLSVSPKGVANPVMEAAHEAGAEALHLLTQMGLTKTVGLNFQIDWDAIQKLKPGVPA